MPGLDSIKEITPEQPIANRTFPRNHRLRHRSRLLVGHGERQTASHPACLDRRRSVGERPGRGSGIEPIFDFPASGNSSRARTRADAKGCPDDLLFTSIRHGEDDARYSRRHLRIAPSIPSRTRPSRAPDEMTKPRSRTRDWSPIIEDRMTLQPIRPHRALMDV